MPLGNVKSPGIAIASLNEISARAIWIEIGMQNAMRAETQIEIALPIEGATAIEGPNVEVTAVASEETIADLIGIAVKTDPPDVPTATETIAVIEAEMTATTETDLQLAAAVAAVQKSALLEREIEVVGAEDPPATTTADPGATGGGRAETTAKAEGPAGRAGVLVDGIQTVGSGAVQIFKTCSKKVRKF